MLIFFSKIAAMRIIYGIDYYSNFLFLMGISVFELCLV